MSEEAKNRVMKFTVKSLDLRKESSNSSLIIKTIPAYSHFELIDSDDEWLKVIYDGRIGYVYKDDVSKTKITTGNVHLRAKPDKKATSMHVIKKHQQVEVVEQAGLWEQVFYDGKLGFVFSEYLTDDGMKWPSDKLANFYYDPSKYLADHKIKSPTPFLISVDLKSRQVLIFEEQKGNWREIDRCRCTIGAEATPTITGIFHLKGRKSAFSTSRYTAKYATCIKEGYYFQSVLYEPSGTKVIDDRLGEALSHGSIRLESEKAKWIYDNMLDGTTVVIH